MIDKAIQIRPGMRVRHVESRTEKTIIRAGGDGRDIITNFGGWLGGEAAFRARHELVDPPAPSEPDRQQKRRLRDGWKGHVPYGWLCTGDRCRGTFTLAKYRGPGQADGACLACAESMGVFQDSAGAATAVHAGQQLVKSRVEPGTTAPATYSCPCARMNLRDLSGDPVCYCTERPKPVRVVGRYGAEAMCLRDIGGVSKGLACNKTRGHLDNCSWHSDRGPRMRITGVATGLAMEARPKSATEVACERAARRYPSTCDSEPSGA